METDFCIRRTRAGSEAIASGNLDRKSLNLLRMADEAVQISTFRRNLRNYGNVDELIKQLLSEGYMERADGQRDKPGLFKRLLGRRKGQDAAVASSVAAQDAAPTLIDATEAARSTQAGNSLAAEAPEAVAPAAPAASAASSAGEQGFGDLPLMSVNEGLPSGDDREFEAGPAALEGRRADSDAEWQREAMTEEEADLISRYTSLLDREE